MMQVSKRVLLQHHQQHQLRSVLLLVHSCQFSSSSSSNNSNNNNKTNNVGSNKKPSMFDLLNSVKTKVEQSNAAERSESNDGSDDNNNNNNNNNNSNNGSTSKIFNLINRAQNNADKNSETSNISNNNDRNSRTSSSKAASKIFDLIHNAKNNRNNNNNNNNNVVNSRVFGNNNRINNNNTNTNKVNNANNNNDEEFLERVASMWKDVNKKPHLLQLFPSNFNPNAVNFLTLKQLHYDRSYFVASNFSSFVPYSKSDFVPLLHFHSPLLFRKIRDIVSNASSVKTPDDLAALLSTIEQTMASDRAEQLQKQPAQQQTQQQNQSEDRKLDTRNLSKFFAERGDDWTSEFFEKTFPFLRSLLLSTEKLFPTPLLLLKYLNQKPLTLSRRKVANILACGFFGIYNPSTFVRASDLNFHSLYRTTDNLTYDAHQREKLTCLMNTFVKISADPTIDEQNILFARCRRMGRHSISHFPSSPLRLQRIRVDKVNAIQDAPHDHAQILFASKYIGGNFMDNVCSEEQIRMLISPESIASIALFEAMEDDDCIGIFGTTKMNNVSGYALNTKFAGDAVDTTPIVSHIRNSALVAIDPLPSRMIPFLGVEYTLRDTIKALSGFSAVNSFELPQGMQFKAVATGNWGCGYFGGDVQVRFIYQWIAAAVAGMPMTYYTRGHPHAGKIEEFTQLLWKRGVTIAKLWSALNSFSTVAGDQSTSVFDYALTHLREKGEIDGDDRFGMGTVDEKDTESDIEDMEVEVDAEGEAEKEAAALLRLIKSQGADKAE